MQIIISVRQDDDEMEDGGWGAKMQACVEHVSKRTRDS